MVSGIKSNWLWGQWVDFERTPKALECKIGSLSVVDHHPAKYIVLVRVVIASVIIGPLLQIQTLRSLSPFSRGVV